MLPWKLQKRQVLTLNQNLLSVYFSLAKFQLVSCNLSLALIWQMTYTHKLPKLCSATLNVLKWQPFKVNIWRRLHNLWGRGEKKACEDQWESHCSRGHRKIFTNFFLFATWFFCYLNKCDNLLTSSEVDMIMSSDPAIKGRQAFTAVQVGDDRLPTILQVIGGWVIPGIQKR